MRSVKQGPLTWLLVGAVAGAGCGSSEGQKSGGGGGGGGTAAGGAGGAAGAAGGGGGSGAGGAGGATAGGAGGGGGAAGGAAGGAGGGAPRDGGAAAADAGARDTGMAPPARDGAAGEVGTSALRVVEFQIPRANNFPHDPAVDSKGVGWWTDQTNSYIGRWDPATNTSMDWPTPTPACGPHGLTPDDQDNIWYTGQRCGRIGKLNPATGMITEYVVPGGGGPHTPIFHKGMIWFTLQQGGRFGRVNPQSGAVDTWPIGSGPYGIWPAPDGTMWVAMFPTNKLVQINPDMPTMLREVTLPRAGTRVRRLAVDKQGFVYYGDNALGPLGRFDPKTNQFKEWPSPGGASAAPYGITIGSDDRVYVFVGANTVAVFNPANEQFETVRIPTSGSIVRHMATDFQRRRVWMALSGIGRMAYIQLP